MIYLDNAATTFPKPAAVVQSAADAMTCYGGNPGRSGHALSLRMGQKVFEVRKQAAALFHTTPECVIFTQNCTQALNFAIHGSLRDGDHVILSDLEHNSVYRPIWKLAKEGRIRYSIAKTTPSAEETVEAFRQLIRPDTRMILCTHASNVTGQILPIAALGALCREKGLLFLVDAAQSAGVLPLDMEKQCIDFLCMAGHKGLYGATGTGMLLLGHPMLLDPLQQGGTGSLSADPMQPDFYPDRLESGTINTVGIVTLGTGMKLITKKGINNIYRHEQQICRKIYEEISKNPQIECYQPHYDSVDYAPIVLFNRKGRSSTEVVSRMSDRGVCLRGGIHCSPLAHEKLNTLEQGTVRISPGMFTTWKQVQCFLHILREECI